MSPTPKDVITQSIPKINPPGVPEGKWPKCECGKTLTTSPEDAQAKAAAAADRYNRHVPLRFYQCTYGVTHWAERYVAVRDCDCGHKSYYDARAASKAAERRNRNHLDRDVSARNYQCHHGGHHVLLYPVGEHLTQCECGAISYRSIHVAARLLAYLRENFPKTEDDYNPYLCAQENRIHIARNSEIPGDATPAVEL